MINFLLYAVLPPGASEVVQTHKFDDFLDLKQFFLYLTGQCFDRNNSCQKQRYEQL